MGWGRTVGGEAKGDDGEEELGGAEGEGEVDHFGDGCVDLSVDLTVFVAVLLEEMVGW